MKRADFERAEGLIYNINESEKEVKRLMDIRDKRHTTTNRDFVCYVIEHFQHPGLMEKLANVASETLNEGIRLEKENIEHLNNLFESL